MCCCRSCSLLIIHPLALCQVILLFMILQIVFCVVVVVRMVWQEPKWFSAECCCCSCCCGFFEGLNLGQFLNPGLHFKELVRYTVLSMWDVHIFDGIYRMVRSERELSHRVDTTRSLQGPEVKHYFATEFIANQSPWKKGLADPFSCQVQENLNGSLTGSRRMVRQSAKTDGRKRSETDGPKKCENKQKSEKTVENKRKQVKKCERIGVLSVDRLLGHFFQWPYGGGI